MRIILSVNMGWYLRRELYQSSHWIANRPTSGYRDPFNYYLANKVRYLCATRFHKICSGVEIEQSIQVYWSLHAKKASFRWKDGRCKKKLFGLQPHIPLCIFIKIYIRRWSYSFELNAIVRNIYIENAL